MTHFFEKSGVVDITGQDDSISSSDLGFELLLWLSISDGGAWDGFGL